MKVVDIPTELEKLTFLKDRTKYTTAEEEDRAFATLFSYRDGGIFAGGFSGESAWERHSNGDEIVHVLDGKTKLTILNDDGPQVFDLSTGKMIVVPQGHWHRFEAPEGVTLMTVTPQPTDISTQEDPRGD